MDLDLDVSLGGMIRKVWWPDPMSTTHVNTTRVVLDVGMDPSEVSS
jgi:hypothetical protein